jgi:alkylation response protein AidB-like acyl-CoA dehydrogenase
MTTPQTTSQGPLERRLTLRLTEDELELQALVRGFLADVVPAPSATATTWSALDPEDKIWWRMADELGVQGLAVPEAFGGQGFGVTELAIVFRELGRVTCAAPLFGTVAMAARLLTNLPGGEHRDRVLRGIANGSLRAAVVTDGEFTLENDLLTGRAHAVIDAPGADVVLVCVGTDVAMVAADADGLALRPQDGMDLARNLGEVVADGVTPTLLTRGSGPAVRRAVREATVLLAAELTGVAEAALQEAVGYSKIRVQFGRPIGSFQALKHRMADMLVATEGAWWTTRHAALLCDADDPAAEEELVRATGVAKASASSAATFVTAENIQVHGGMGFTYEHPAHLRFRRARSSSVLLGSAAEHRAKVAVALTSGDAHGRP